MLNESQFAAAQALHGAGSTDPLFHRSLITPAPWPSMGKLKDGSHHDTAAIQRTLSSAPVLEDVDPVHLHASQPNVLREHVDYYMRGDYERTGRTARDGSVDSNQYPVVYERPDGRRDIISGHHRAAAALLRGEPLRSRVVRP